MNGLDPDLASEFKQLQEVLGLLNGRMNSYSKSATLREIQEKAYLKQLSELTKKSGEDVEALAKKIKAEERAAEYEERRSKAMADGFKLALNGLKDFTKGSISAVQGMYNTEQVFSGVTPVISLMGTTINNVVTAMAAMAGGVPILGGLAEGAAKLVGVGIDIVTQVANMQLENAQKYVDSYNKLSKVGVTFGADLVKMRESAAEGGLALDAYTKFVTNNIESLSTFGGSTQHAADQVMRLTKTVTTNNDKLLVMYGSFEAVNDAAVNYISMMSSTGYNVTKNINSLNAGAVNYLFNMKELSALTGESADAIKKEQEARNKHAAFQMRLNQIATEGGEAGAEQAQQIRNSITLARKMYGPEMADYMEEYVANNGRVISETGLQFRAFNGILADQVGPELLKAAMSPGQDVGKNMAEIVKNYSGPLEEFYKKQIGLAQLNYGVQDTIIQQQNSVMSQILSTLNRQREMADAQVEINKAAKADPTDEAKNYADALRALNDFKKGMDGLTEKSFKDMASIAGTMYGAMFDLYGIVKPEMITDAMKKFADAVKTATDALKDLADTSKPNTGVLGSTGRGKDLFGNEWSPPVQEGSGAIKRGLGKGNEVQPTPTPVPGIKTNDTSKFTTRLKPTANSGEFDARLPEMMNKLAENFPIATINAVNDASKIHQEINKTSKHPKGEAVDFSMAVKGFVEGVAKADEMNKLLAGAAKVEFHQRGYKGANADHFHMELMKNGGIKNSPAIGGEAGPEAFVPLPDGRTIPVTMDNSGLIAKLEELISVAKDHRDNSEKLLWAQS